MKELLSAIKIAHDLGVVFHGWFVAWDVEQEIEYQNYNHARSVIARYKIFEKLLLWCRYI